MRSVLRTSFVALLLAGLSACGNDGDGVKDLVNSTNPQPELHWDRGNWDEKEWQ